MHITSAIMSLRIILKKSPEGIREKFHFGWKIPIFASIFLSLMLIACVPKEKDQSASTAAGGVEYQRYILQKEGFSMDYPKDWYVEDAHKFGSVGFFPQKPNPGDEAILPIQLGIISKFKDVSLQKQAMNDKEDMEDLGKITCGEPAPVSVQGIPGMLLTCSPGRLDYILEGSKLRFSVLIPTETIPESIWKHMLESIKID